jgi:L-serine/L-threonine ammonia-lyase
MQDLHINTPLIQSTHVGQSLDANIWLKIETLQPCGSFKARGVGYACTQYVKDGAKALVSSSGGNAGLAVAYSGRCLDVPATVVVPTTTKKRAIDLIKHEGAKVIVTGENWDAAHIYATELSQKESAAYIHPFDDPYIWTGHASIIDEIAEANVTPDAIVLSVGGGGLLCGVVEGLQRNNWNDVPILAVETKGADSLSVASLANQHIGIDIITSIATTLGAKKVAQQAFNCLQEHPTKSQVVTDKGAVDACYRFLEDHKLMVEPACGASLAAVYQACSFLKDKKNILVIVCGGAGVTVEQLQEWRQQTL